MILFLCLLSAIAQFVLGAAALLGVVAIIIWVIFKIPKHVRGILEACLGALYVVAALLIIIGGLTAVCYSNCKAGKPCIRMMWGGGGKR